MIEVNNAEKCEKQERVYRCDTYLKARVHEVNRADINTLRRHCSLNFTVIV